MKEEILRAIDKLIFAINEHKEILLTGKCKNINEMGGRQECIEVYEIALTALQEQLDRLEGCNRCNGTYKAADIAGDTHTHVIVGKTLYHYDSKIGFEGEDVRYCFNCGRELSNICDNTTTEYYIVFSNGAIYGCKANSPEEAFEMGNTLIQVSPYDFPADVCVVNVKAAPHF